MPNDASELAHRLARYAEAVCRHYLSNGRRQGRYWMVGDVRNMPGRSMYVRLHGPVTGPGAAGHWTDAASGEHGDLLDVIRHSCGLTKFHDVAREARRFLSLPPPVLHTAPKPMRLALPRSFAAQRLFAMSQPIHRTLVASYLHNRDIVAIHHAGALRFHPRCFYREHEEAPTQTWPAMIACVTDLSRHITGAHRTWLDPNGFDPIRLGKAPITTPRRAMGNLLGNAVRFGIPDDVLAAGEGIETMLSLRYAIPAMPMAAALSAIHLAALLLPATLRRLYIARDADRAGDYAFAALTTRAATVGVEALPLSPRLGDFNEDLCAFGIGELRTGLRSQLAPDDVERFMPDDTAEPLLSACKPRSA